MTKPAFSTVGDGYIGAILGYIGVILGLYWGYLGIILGCVFSCRSTLLVLRGKSRLWISRLTVSGLPRVKV